MSIILGILSFARLTAAIKLRDPNNCPSGRLLTKIVHFRETIKRIEMSSRLDLVKELKIFFG